MELKSSYLQPASSTLPSSTRRVSDKHILFHHLLSSLFIQKDELQKQSDGCFLKLAVLSHPCLRIIFLVPSIRCRTRSMEKEPLQQPEEEEEAVVATCLGPHSVTRSAA